MATQQSEVVLKLTGDILDSAFVITMHGSSGIVEVRNLTVVAVRHLLSEGLAMEPSPAAHLLQMTQ
jgi:hypothetical protein